MTVIEMRRKIAIRTSGSYCIAIPNKLVAKHLPLGTPVKVTIEKMEDEYL